MSMRGHIVMEDTNREDDEAWIEEEIARELKALDSTDLDIDPEHEPCAPETNIIISDDDEEEEGLPSDLQDYVKHMQEQTERLEKDLEECDQLLQETDKIVSTPRPHQEDLVNLALERGEDVAAMKRRVLEDLEREDLADERIKLESVNEDILEVNLQLKEIQPEETPLENGKPEEEKSEEGTEEEEEEEGKPVFLTAPEEQKLTEEEEYQELKRRFLGQPQEEEQAAEHEEEEQEEEGEEEIGTLQPGEGIVMAAIDPASLEQKILREVLDWEDQWLETNQRRQEVVKRLTEEETIKMEEDACKREEKMENVRQQQEHIHRQQEEFQEKILKESEETQQQIEESLNKYQVEYEEIAESVRQESEALEQAKGQNAKNEEEKRHKSANKIQACYRGYRVYKEEGKKVKEHLESWKEEKTKARITALEESRRKKTEDRKKKKVPTATLR